MINFKKQDFKSEYRASVQLWTEMVKLMAVANGGTLHNCLRFTFLATNLYCAALYQRELSYLYAYQPIILGSGLESLYGFWVLLTLIEIEVRTPD